MLTNSVVEVWTAFWVSSIRVDAHCLRDSRVSMRERSTASLEWTDAHSKRLATVPTVVTNAVLVAPMTCLMLAMMLLLVVDRKWSV